MISTGSSNLPRLGLNPSGATMNDELKIKFKKAITELNIIWDEVITQGLQNEQETLDFLDKLNEISVRN